MLCLPDVGAGSMYCKSTILFTTSSVLITNIRFFSTFCCLILGLGQSANRNLEGTPFSTGMGLGTTLRPAYPTTLTTNIAGWGKAKTLLLLNTPQALVSLMNVLYNGCLTSMMLVGKWNSFSQHRHPLRVTVPLGEQKSQYYLTIPYRYAIPLLAITGTFHWLISESFFLVSLTAFRDTEIQPQDSVFAIGYSALSIALAAGTCFSLIAILAFKSLQRYEVGMPVAGSCSVVISAACHKAEREEAPQLKKVMWGVVKDASGERPGHCSFTLKLVKPPTLGELYA